MSEIQQRSILTAPGDLSVEYPAGHVGNRTSGMARVSLTGSWSGGVSLYNALADGVWTFVKTYASGPEDDIAIVCTKEEKFRFEAQADFSGSASVIVSQGEVVI